MPVRARRVWVVLLLPLLGCSGADGKGADGPLPTLDLPAKDQVKGLELAGRVSALLARDALGWTVRAKADEPAYPADAAQVDAALDAAQELAVLGRVSPADADFGTPTRVTWVLASGARLSWEFGALTASGGVAMRVADRPEVFSVSGSFPWTVRYPAEQWRQDVLLDGRPHGVESVGVSVDGGPEVKLVQLDRGKWAPAKDAELPAEYRFDSDAAQRWVQRLFAVRPRTLLPLGELPQGPSQAVVRVAYTAGPEVELQLLASPATGVRVQPRAFGASVSAADAALLQLRWEDLFDRGVFAFSIRDVERIAWRGGGDSVELARVEGAWKLLTPAPERFMFDPDQVTRFLESLRKLRTSGTAPSGRRGTPKVAFEVELVVQSQPQRLTVEAAPDGQAAVAQSTAQPHPFLLAAADWAYLAQGLQAFRLQPPASEWGHGLTAPEMPSVP